MLVIAAAINQTGCQSEGGAQNHCVSNTDCAASFSCIDGACKPPPRLTSNDTTSDRGPLVSFDAGYDAGRRVDAGSPEVDAADGGQCGPSACLAQGAACGQIMDDCGAIVGCGVCAKGACGEAGTADANRCVGCTPRVLTCPAGAECGSIDDGCGSPISCGTCGPGEMCSSSQQCIPLPPTCADRCSQASAVCGSIGNDCDCGRCGSEQTCRNNRCASTCTPQCPSSRVGSACGNSVSDGCGGRRNCGCGNGLTCTNGTCQTPCTVRQEETTWLPFRSAQSNPLDGANSGWLNTERAASLNGSGANVYFTAPRRAGTCNITSSYRSNLLRLYNANINIPSDATVRGVRVRVTARTEGARPTLHTLHLWGPRSSGSPLVTRGPSTGDLVLTAGWSSHKLGHQNDRWGVGDALTAAVVNHEWFGLRVGFNVTLQCNGADSNALVDGGEVKVWYEACR